MVRDNRFATTEPVRAEAFSGQDAAPVVRGRTGWFARDRGRQHRDTEGDGRGALRSDQTFA